MNSFFKTVGEFGKVLIPPGLLNKKMFKKDRDIEEKSRTLLKNKEIRTLKSHILEQFGTLNAEGLTLLFHSKVQVTSVKLINRTNLYYIDKKLSFIALENRTILSTIASQTQAVQTSIPSEVLLPSLCFLWSFPNCTKFFVIHPEVSEFILNGADLMLRGVHSFNHCELLKVGEIVCIKVIKNPMPFAVGISLIDHNAIISSSSSGPVASKLKGKAMIVLHCYNDILCKHGSESPDGFTIKKINAITGTSTDTPSLHDDQGKDIIEKESTISNEINTTEFIPVLNTPAENLIETTQQFDEMLLIYTLRTLKYVVKDALLPILISTLWTYIQRCAQFSSSDQDTPLDILDIKNTSYKKVSTFFKYCCQIGLLKIEEQNEVASLHHVDRSHRLFFELKNYIKILNPSKLVEDIIPSTIPTSGAGAGGGGASKEKKSNGSGGDGLKVFELYKFPKAWRDVFGNVRGEYGEYLKCQEVRDVIMKYIVQSDEGHEMDDKVKKSQNSIVELRPSDPFYEIVFHSPCVMKAESLIDKPPMKPSTVEKVQKVEDDDEEEELETPSTGLDYVGGVWLPTLTKSHHDIGIKFNKDQLQDVSSGQVGSVVQPPVSRIKGSSSIGGWGVDPDKTWKPVSLPSQPVSLPAPTSMNQKKVGTNSTSSSVEKESVKSKELQNILIIKKEDLMKWTFTKLSPYYIILSSAGDDHEDRIHSGSIPKVHIVIESRVGNKMVTIVRGIDHYLTDLQIFCKECQKKFACSATIGSMQTSKEKELILQGSFGYEIEDFLIISKGIPRSVIEITAAKNIKLKKKG